MAKIKQHIVSKVEVVSTDDIRPAAYNPRQVFRNRLELVKLSLSKLGFLLPIYVAEDGTILSGHQRHYVATEMLGAKRVPIVRCKKMTIADAKKLNLLFNRATNDTAYIQSSESLAEALANSPVPKLAAALPDLEIGSDEWMPILAANDESVVEILDNNHLWLDDQGVVFARDLAAKGGTELMPIVITESKRLVNGRARIMAAAKDNIPTIKAVTIPEDRYEVANGLLNLLAMKYEVEGKLADDLRAHAHKAAPSVRHSMSVNACIDLLGLKSPKGYFDPSKKEHADAWLKHYGPNTLDMGAGMYWDAKHAEMMGANAAAFEPYYDFDLEASREMAEKWFFSRVIDGRQFNSVFMSNVYNSIPFQSDRNKVTILIATLCGPETTFHCSGRHVKCVTSESRQRIDRVTKTTTGRSITLDGEMGLVINSVVQMPLVQKFHSRDTFHKEIEYGFDWVESHSDGRIVWATARKPKKFSPEQIVDAIRFEFDLPWQAENSNEHPRFGRVDRALEVFSARLGIDLVAVDKAMGPRTYGPAVSTGH